MLGIQGVLGQVLAMRNRQSICQSSRSGRTWLEDLRVSLVPLRGSPSEHLSAPASCGRKPPAGEIQIGERQQREHLCAVLGDAAIAHLAVAERSVATEGHFERCDRRPGAFDGKRVVRPMILFVGDVAIAPLLTGMLRYSRQAIYLSTMGIMRSAASVTPAQGTAECDVSNRLDKVHLASHRSRS